MTRKTYRRFALFLSTLLIAMALSTGSAPQVACASCGTLLPIWTYYTDATMTVPCGTYNWCWNDQQGCVTEFKTSRREICHNCD